MASAPSFKKKLTNEVIDLRVWCVHSLTGGTDILNVTRSYVVNSAFAASAFLKILVKNHQINTFHFQLHNNNNLNNC